MLGGGGGEGRGGGRKAGRGWRVQIPARPDIFLVEIDHKIIATAIFSFHWSRIAVFSKWRKYVHKHCLSLSRKRVSRLTDRLDMTFIV